MTQPTYPTRGNCTNIDPEVMFPEPGDRAGEAEAKHVCVGCPAAGDCLAWALTGADSGVWGGLTERERRLHKRRRARVTSPA